MAVKKSELYSTLWQSCDKLRGGMDASQYKDYVLTLLFVKYVSDKYKGKKYAKVEIPEGGSFDDMVALKGKPDIGDGMNKIIGKLAQANGLAGVITQADFNNNDHLGSGKEMRDRLTDLIGIFQNPALNFKNQRAEDDDILGDAYEFLMRHFATESGKSKGQFYTPAEVSRVLASVIEVDKADSQEYTVYDPTCGSGSLLLKVADESKKGLTIYGQENENATRGLAVMNMWLHGQEEAVVLQGNTIADPKFTDNGQLKRFDFVVANPPFSNKNWSQGLIDDQSKQVKDPFGRFDGFGVPPLKNGDYTFLLHIVKSLKNTGKGAVILPHGVLFRGNAEATIREQLIKRGLIKGIIGLPANLFYGTGIPACIIVLDKEHAANRKGIFMIDASKGYTKDGNKNRLREQDIHRMVDIFNKQVEVEKYSRFVLNKEIEENEFNLNIPRYVDTREEEDIQDLDAHLNGGIPARDIDALEQYWKSFRSLKDSLFEQSSRAGYYDLKVDPQDVRSVISGHLEFKEFTENALHVFSRWKDNQMNKLRGINVDTRPKGLIHELGEELLEAYRSVELVSEYNMYQHLMDFWNETMKDDVYMIIEGGWKADLFPVLNSKGKAVKDQFYSELIPSELVINRYFLEEKERLERLETELSSVQAEMENLKEEHSGDEGLMAEVLNDKGNITKGALDGRIKEVKGSVEDAEEFEILKQIKGHLNSETKLKAEIKEKEQDLNKKVINRYQQLSEQEVQQLVIEDKWMLAVEDRIVDEVNDVNQSLSQGIQELTTRYSVTLSEIEAEVKDLSNKVDAHLKAMGLVW